MEASKSLSLLRSFTLQRPQVAALPLDLREELLAYLQRWGEAQEQIDLVNELTLFQGPLLGLLDCLAVAHFQAGNYASALEVIERRQRRSTTIASQALEARALLAAGHAAHARAVADDISQAYPLNLTALAAAGEVYAAQGDFDHARGLLDLYLQAREHTLLVSLTLAELALTAGQEELTREYARLLGSGIPAGIGDEPLQRLQRLLARLGYQESARSAEMELEQRRRMQQQQIQRSLAPFAQADAATLADPAEFYRSLNGPESVEVSRAEQRTIRLETVRHFGFMELRPAQTEIVAAVLRGESILAVLPTGAGKSLCYQLPALLLPRATLVISPLIALMKDQVESLPAAAREKATFINSTLTDEEMQERLRGVAEGSFKLIYAAPERLRQRAFLRALRQAGLSLFVLDEAHCVSMWGHDFRPDYLFIQEARAELGGPNALAMTATAPPRVRDEILDHIRQTQTAAEAAPAARVVSLDIFRSNLHLSALRFHNDEEKIAALIQFVVDTEGSGIVYANSRRKCEALALLLQAEGVSAAAYHAGLADRGRVQDQFMADKIRVVVATVAFGMGIDKSDIRFIVHFHPPRSLESYYQEAGRAGRDSQPAQCVLFYSNNDWSNLRRWARADQYSVEFLQQVYNAVATQLGVPPVGLSGEGSAGLADSPPVSPHPTAGPVSVRRLEQVLSEDETKVRVAVSQLERAGLLARSFDVPQEVEITLARKAAAAPQPDQSLRRLLQGLALKPGAGAAFQLKEIAALMDWDLDAAEAQLLAWQEAGIFHVKGSKRVMFIQLPTAPEHMQERLERLLGNTAVLAQRRIDNIIGYATGETCRHGYISAHFGSVPRSSCLVCDNCTGQRPDIPLPTRLEQAVPEDGEIEPMIIDCLVSLPKPVGRSGLARILAGNLRAPVQADACRHYGRLYVLGEAAVIDYVDEMIEDGRLRQYERQGYPVLAATLRGRAEANAWLAEHAELTAPTAAPATVEDDEAPLVAPPEEGAADIYTDLQRALWSWRRRLAAELAQPPYVIMSNKLMLQIAQSRPHSLDELQRLPGMGDQRLERYGPVILDLVQLHPPQSGDEEKLAGQVAALEGKGSQRLSTAEEQSPVSPQLERRIFMRLQELRQKVAVGQGTKPYLVAGNGLLKIIARRAPSNAAQLAAVTGFRSSGLQEQAQQILEIVETARREGTQSGAP